MSTPQIQHATAIGLRFLGLLLAEERGDDWSVRVNTSFCGGARIFVVTLIHRDARGALRYEPFVGGSLLELLERAGRMVEGEK